MSYCPQCRSEYREGVQVCASCGAALVHVLPPLPKRPGVIIPRLKRFFARFAGRDTSPPRLQSFLLEQPPDWRHTALAFLVVFGMAMGGVVSRTWELQRAIAPITYTRGGAPLHPPAGVTDGWGPSPLTTVADVVLGCGILGLVGALIARRKAWLWGPAGLLAGLAADTALWAAMYPYGKPIAAEPRSMGISLTWRFSASVPGLLLIALAFASAAAGGLLSGTSVRRWAVGIVSVCAPLGVLGWTAPGLIALVFSRMRSGVAMSGASMTILELAQHGSCAVGGTWIGYVMRRRGWAWGSAVGLFALYAVLFGGFRVYHFPPFGLLDIMLPYVKFVIFQTLPGAVGGLIGQYLWQWKAARAAGGAAIAQPGSPPSCP